MRLRLLRMLLFFSAFAWGISIVGVFVPWSIAVELLQGLGLKNVAYDPMLDYWLRMASGAFFLVGILFLLFAVNPKKYAGRHTAVRLAYDFRRRVLISARSPARSACISILRRQHRMFSRWNWHCLSTKKFGGELKDPKICP